jgi:hypothetical protein
VDDRLTWVRYVGGPLDRVVHHLRESPALPESIRAQGHGGTGRYVAEGGRDREGSWLYGWTGVDPRLPRPPFRIIEIVPMGAQWPRVGAQFTYLNPGGPIHGSFRILRWGHAPGHPRRVWLELEGTDESPAPHEPEAGRPGRPRTRHP